MIYFSIEELYFVYLCDAFDDILVLDLQALFTYIFMNHCVCTYLYWNVCMHVLSLSCE